MNRGEMRTQTRILLGETIGDGYTDAEINTALNTSALTVARDTMPLQTSRNLALIAYNDPLLVDPEDPRKHGSYALPDDFLSMIGVEILDGDVWHDLGKALSFHEFRDRARTTQGGRPQCFYLEMGAVSLTSPRPGDMHFWPYPDAAYVARRTFYQKPTPMAGDTDTTEVPETGHLGICYHAAMILSRKFKDRILIQEMIALWQDEERRIKAIVNVSDLTGPFRMKNVYGR